MQHVCLHVHTYVPEHVATYGTDELKLDTRFDYLPVFTDFMQVSDQ